ncbi:MAG: histidine--tRNA ligase, partial [Oscillospiraceae bacterium]
MQYIKTPMKGMPEQLPADMQLREYLLGKIKTTYSGYGFSLIETPAIEHIENLTSKQG